MPDALHGQSDSLDAASKEGVSMGHTSPHPIHGDTWENQGDGRRFRVMTAYGGIVTGYWQSDDGLPDGNAHRTFGDARFEREFALIEHDETVAANGVQTRFQISDPKHLAYHLRDETEPVTVTIEDGHLVFEGKACGGWRCAEKGLGSS